MADFNVITNSTKNTVVTGTSGADSITNTTNKVTIDAGDGNDTINNNNPYSPYSGEAVSISGGAGNDLINDGGGNNSLIGGKGNDTINLSSGVIQYANGDGADVVSMYGGDYYKGITLKLAAGTTISKYAINTRTSDHTLTIGKGSITFKNIDSFIKNLDHMSKLSVRTAKTGGGYEYTKYVNGVAFNDNVSVNSNGYTEYLTKGTDNADYIDVYGYDNEMTVDGGAADDYLDVGGDGLNIIGGAGKDTIFASSITNSTVDGGADNDLIQVVGGSTWNESNDSDTGNANVLVLGGKGNDTIRNKFINMPNSYTKITNDDYRNATVTSYLDSKTNTYVTVSTWVTNDADEIGTSTVTSTLIYDRTIVYADGDGNDVIEDYHAGEVIKFADSNTVISNSAVKGNNVVLTIGSGSITLKDVV
ncbi:MAG: hypothetical protein IJ563_02210, partial [Selenomonadaceae bacterium]|nr:hypothetical protein [Selenomonadaceae bacterium]